LGTGVQRTSVQWRFPQKNASGCRKNWNLALRSGSTLVLKKCIDLDLSLLIILILGHVADSLWKMILQRSRRLLPADMLERWPHSFRVKITFTSLLTNRFVSTKFDEMPCTLDSTENPRSFEKNPIPPKMKYIFAARLVARISARTRFICRRGCSVLQCVAVYCRNVARFVCRRNFKVHL